MIVRELRAVDSISSWLSSIDDEEISFVDIISPGVIIPSGARKHALVAIRRYEAVGIAQMER